MVGLFERQPLGLIVKWKFCILFRLRHHVTSIYDKLKFEFRPGMLSEMHSSMSAKIYLQDYLLQLKNHKINTIRHCFFVCERNSFFSFGNLFIFNAVICPQSKLIPLIILDMHEINACKQSAKRIHSYDLSSQLNSLSFI